MLLLLWIKKLDKEDYGQTLGTWGVKEGCYFVYLFGSYNCEGSLGSMVNFTGGDAWYNVTISNDINTSKIQIIIIQD